MCARRGSRKRQLQQMLERGMIAISMSRLRIPIYFDYASTLCYIAWRIVTPLEDELGFEALWKGVPIAARDFRAKPGRVLGERGVAVDHIRGDGRLQTEAELAATEPHSDQLSLFDEIEAPWKSVPSVSPKKRQSSSSRF